MASNYPRIAGNYIARVVQNQIPATPSGGITTVTLAEALPGDMVSVINDQYPVYATLGCRVSNTIEYVLVEKSSYNGQTKTLRLIRGQSPYGSCTGGESRNHNSFNPNSIELNFNTISPCTLNNLISDVDGMKNNIASYIQANIANASTVEKGLVTTSYFNPDKSITEPYAAVTSDNPFLRDTFAKILDLEGNAEVLKFDRPTDAPTAAKLESLRQIFSYFYNNPAKVSAFISFLNTL